jgi:7,8-dihydroneopterin aldolase/epimerase/oxygenase
MMGKISLEGLEFFAYHGFSQEEQKVGNRYGIDITIEVDFAKAAQQDKINSTVDYHALYKVISKEMAESTKLLESIAERIVIAVFHHFSQVSSIEISVSKFNPPIGGICQRARIIMKRERNEVSNF